MCCQNRTPRCTICHRRCGSHRRNCPSNPHQISSPSTPRQISSPSNLRPLSSFSNIPQPQPSNPEFPPSYHAVIDPQPETSTLFPGAVPAWRRCGVGHGYGYGRGVGQGGGVKANHCRGPVNLFVGYLMRKHQEKKERESGIVSEEIAADEKKQEQSVVDSEDEEDVKEDEKDVKKEVKKEEDEKDAKVLMSSVRSMSL